MDSNKNAGDSIHTRNSGWKFDKNVAEHFEKQNKYNARRYFQKIWRNLN